MRSGGLIVCGGLLIVVFGAYILLLPTTDRRPNAKQKAQSQMWKLLGVAQDWVSDSGITNVKMLEPAQIVETYNRYHDRVGFNVSMTTNNMFVLVDGTICFVSVEDEKVLVKREDDVVLLERPLVRGN